MKGYVLSIAGIVLISAVISIIAPSGRMGKFVKGMTRLFIFVVLITPFVRFARDPKTLLPSAELDTDESYLAAYSKLLSREDVEEVGCLLKSRFGVEAEVEVSRSFDDFSYEKIIVHVTDFGINGEETHIDILSAIGREIGERYGCKTEVT